MKLRGQLQGEALDQVRAGVQLAEGKTGGARVTVRKRGRDYTHVVVTLHEGMNREIRRVFAKVGYKVVGLERSRIGNLTGRGLRSGWWRRLKPTEVRADEKTAAALAADHGENAARELGDFPAPIVRRASAMAAR